MSPRNTEPGWHGPPARGAGLFRWLQGPWPAVLLGFFCFANSFTNGFTYDDNALVRKNPRIRSLANFRAIWLTDWWYERTDDEPILDPRRDRLYRPLTMFSFALNYAIHQSRPAGYHVANVLLHAVVCLLVWHFARRLFADEAIAAIAAVLFAVHPVHAEAVAGIVGRGEILAAGFMLLGLLVLLPRDGSLGVKRGLLAAPAFLAALLSKETAACFPLVALLTLQAARARRRLRARRWLVHVALLLVPLVIYFPLRYYALEERFIRDRLSSILFNPLQDADLAGRFHGPLTILGHYARLLLVPSRLSCDYGLAVFNPHEGPELMTLVGVAMLAALVAALIGYRRRTPTWRRLAVLAAMFLVSYVLISNTFLLIGVSLAERLMYWPSVPVLLAVSVAVVGFWRTYCQRGQPLQNLGSVLPTLAVALLVVLGARSAVRSADWKHDEPLFKADLAIPDDWEGWPEATADRWHRHSAHLYKSLAQLVVARASEVSEAVVRWSAAAETTSDEATRQQILNQIKRLRQEKEIWIQRGEELLRRALAIYSRYPDALELRARIHLSRGEPERALEYLESALWLAPADVTAQRLAARLRGDVTVSEARVAELQAAIAQQPREAALRLELGAVLVRLGRNYEALQQYERAVELAPESVLALRGYGEALLLNLQRDQALAVFQRVVFLDPDDWQAHANLSTLLADRDPAKALRHAQIAFQLQPNHLNTQLNLAEAYALNGYAEEALRRLRAIASSLPADDPRRQAVADRIVELQRAGP